MRLSERLREFLGAGPSTSFGKTADAERVSEDELEDAEFELRLDATDIVDRRIAELAAPHLATFARKYHQLVFVDDYGLKIVDKWYRELGYFIDNVVMRDPEASSWLESSSYSNSSFMGRESLCLRLDTYIVGENWDYVRAYKDEAYDPSMAGADYERFVAAKLEKAGMQVSYTPATGDQGADLLAAHGGKRIAVQCKRSITPVGNKAVQEAAAGRGYYGASEAWVVSDATFTIAAKRLAGRVGVRLLHHGDLDSVPV